MNYIALIPLLSAISVLSLGVLVFLHGKKDRVNFTFFLHAIAIAIWLFGTFMMFLSQGDPDAAIFWDRFVYAGVVFIVAFMHHFKLAYTKQKNDALLYIAYALSFTFLILSRTDYFVADLFTYKWGVHAKAQIAHHFFLLYFFIYVVNWFIGMYKYYKNITSRFLKEQAKYVFAGFLVLFSIGPLAYLPAYGIGVYPFAFISGVLFTVIIAYAIVVHRLLDIKLVMRKWSVYFTSIISVIIPAFFIEYGFSDLFGVDSFLTDILIIAIAVAFFPVIKNYYFNFANKYLFSSLYDSKQVITHLSEQLGSTLELDRIYNLIDETLSNAFHSKAVGVLKFNKKTNEYAIKYDHGFNFGKIKTLKANKKILDSYVLKNKIIITEELKNAKNKEFAEVVGILEKMGIEILTPLNLKNETIGMIVIGPKESGDMYNDEDFGVLKIMGSQVAIAMENAFLYEKTRNFNKKLKKEVEVATADLVAANEQLKKLDAAKSEFISIASHQLRTPLTAIKGYISMMLEGDFGQLTKTEAESLQKVFESNERLIRLVENLLNISRIESGRLQFNYVDTQLENMVESVIDELSNNAKKKGLKLEFRKPSAALPKVNIDDEKIRQVVMNLIDNAIKYTKQGSVTVSLEQTFVGNPEPKPELVFSVSDSGMGIRKEDLPHLFQKFSRGTGTSLVHTEGTGLGLYVARQMIEAHKGEIWAESKGEGLGSKFCFKLPV